MADELPSLHIDTDWKKQAQEEKKRLADEQAKREAAAKAPVPVAAPAGPTGATAAAATEGARSRAARGQRETPVANVGSLIQSILTQALFYLGELAPAGSEPSINLDMAKHQIDTLNVVEEKTRNNLAPDEQHLLDAALYEARMRFVNVASQYL